MPTTPTIMSHRGVVEVNPFAEVEEVQADEVAEVQADEVITEVASDMQGSTGELPPVPSDPVSTPSSRHGSGARSPTRASPKREARSASTGGRLTAQRSTLSLTMSELPGPGTGTAGQLLQESTGPRIEDLMREFEALKVRMDIIESKDASEKLSIHEAKLERRLNTVDTNLEQCATILSSFEGLEERLSETVIPISSRLRKLEHLSQTTSERLTDLNLKVMNIKDEQRPPPQTFDMSSPEPAEVQEPVTRIQAFPSVGQPTPTFASQQILRGNPWEPAPAAPAAPIAPWAGQEVPDFMKPKVPEVVTTSAPLLRVPPPPPRPFTFGATAPPGIPQSAATGSSEDKHVWSQNGLGKSIRKEVSYVISLKGTDDLWQFKGGVNDFIDWKQKMIDHFAISTQQYRALIENIGKATQPITKADLIQTQVDGFNAWEVSEELCTFTLKWLDEKIAKDRYHLCGGVGQENNGFELWRKLYTRYGGGSKIVSVGGFQRFTHFPRCENLQNLEGHMAEWERLKDEYAGSLKDDEAALRIMFLGILPEAEEQRVSIKEAKYPDWKSIKQHLIEKNEMKRQHDISKALHKPVSKVTGRTYANALGVENNSSAKEDTGVPAPEDTSRQPTMQDIYNMMNAMQNVHRPNPKAKAKARGRAQDSKTQDRKKTGFGKFFFKGCWECGVDGHSRHECPNWLRILDSDGRPPASHKGKKDIALEKWKQDRTSFRKNRINVIGVEAEADDFSETEYEDDFTEDDDDDDELDYIIPARMINALSHLKTPTPVVNKYEPLSEEGPLPCLMNDISEDEGPKSCPEGSKTLELLNKFAHHVHEGKKLSQRAAAKREHRFKNRGVVIQCEADFNKPEVRHMIRALPQDEATLQKLAKLCPTDSEKLKPGEFWCLLDTGSTVSAMKVTKTLPNYAHLVKPVPEGQQSKTAETACGGKVRFDGQIELTGHIDGDLHTMTFNDMDVTMPIASMSESVHHGNELHIKKGGGTITNVKSGKVVNLHEREGVYFFKMSLLPPQVQERYAQLSRKPKHTAKNKQSVFSRPA